MQLVVTNVAWLVSVGLSVSLLDMSMTPAKMAEPIEMLFWLWTRGGQSNYGGP